MKKLGIDFGDKRIGIALSDETNFIASPLLTYERKHYKLDVDYICSLAAENNVDVIVFGLPLNMNGTRGERVELTEEFAASVKQKSGLAVEFIDERLTSVEAERVLNSANAGVRSAIKKQKSGQANKNDVNKHKQYVDKMCAAIILQCYLDKRRI